jgi:hypothetical protein
VTKRQREDRLYKEHVIQRLLDAAERLMWELAEDEPDADLEPSMGSLSGDQRRWAAGALDEREEVCEDEGAQCEDEGAEHDGREPCPGEGVPTYHPEDQRQLLGTVFGGRAIYTVVGGG